MKLCPNCFSSGTMRKGACVVCGFSQHTQREERALPAGVILHRRYVLGRVLGVGGFGITYVAYDQKEHGRLAVKEYFPAEWAMRASQGNQIIPNSRSQKDVYRRGKEVFINEAEVLRKLRKVPSIVDVRDLFQENGTAYMVMELLEGSTLSGYMKAQQIRMMPWEQADRIIRDAGMALEQVHAMKLLHRDIGPDNIMMDKDGTVHLIDFGATRIYAMDSQKSMSVLLKPGFTPIEQYSRKGEQGPWTDVYALAATYYYLVTGKKPPEAPDRISGVQLMSLSQCVPGIPEDISRAVEHALCFKWQQRTRDVKGFLKEMGLLQIPVSDMVVRGRWRRYPFGDDRVLTIGRMAERSRVVLDDSQVSGLHCKIVYDPSAGDFLVENYSGNCTFTSRGTLERGQKAFLKKGEWIYIQTAKERYIFYMEVE